MAMIPRFRAWDKEFKEMVQVDALVFDEQIIKATYKNGNVAKEDLKNYVLMQSTGLRDKNGKEIFEGDILKVTNLSIWLEVVSFNKNKAMFVSKEVKRKVEETPLYDLFNTDIFEIEIIGNIHTNSELAEVEQ
ncbi:YopX family protein [Streptococcus salivarius]|uniref:YopX family protein n=1 Tax=Streptococcus salivarius TaxID=1304 RepID=UPI0039C4BF2D